ncbi:MAG: zinc-binding dehydrogenase [Flavobacteriales bacterium]|nr:zinc-binding dehydrogenase [Flavobacteriales bacterium]
MKAWTLTAHGDPRTSFALHEHPDPVPTSNQVLIRSEGFGLNYADVMAAKGLYRDAPPLPSILGYEVVGRVVQAGADVPPHMIGKRVVAMTRFGGYGQLVTTDHRACAELPDDVPLGEAAALATQGCTAWFAAHLLCPLMPGQQVLVHSAAGGVGQLLVQIALQAGCTVYAVAKGALKMQQLKALGAQHVIDRGAGNYADAVRAALGDRRLDVSFNAVGGSSFKQDMALLGSHGRIVLYGGAERGGIAPFGTLRFVWRMGLVLPIFLMMKSQSILGLNMLRISENKPELIAHCLQAVVEAQRTGRLKAHVHATYPADQLAEAHVALAGGRTMGKVAVAW